MLAGKIDMVREKTLVAPKILSGCAASMLTNANRSADGGFPKVNASGFEKRNRRLRFMAGALLMAGDDPPMAGWWQIKKTALTCSAQVLPRLFYDWLEAVAGGAGRFRGPGLSVVAATSDALVVCDCCTSPLPSPWTRGGIKSGILFRAGLGRCIRGMRRGLRSSGSGPALSSWCISRL